MLLILLLLLVLLLLTYFRPKPQIYCVLLTGKNEARYRLVPIAISNFESQDYKNKYLLIINHGNQQSLYDSKNDRIKEIMVVNEGKKLGDFRNQAFDYIPKNALWIPFDDDDYRKPEYLSILENKLYSTGADAVFLRNRLDHNLNTGFTYRCHFLHGIPHILSKNIDGFRYLSADTLEDANLQTDLRRLKKKYVVFENDPSLYIRYIHQHNTSPYVDISKRSIIEYAKSSSYNESESYKTEKQYASHISRLYSNVFT